MCTHTLAVLSQSHSIGIRIEYMLSSFFQFTKRMPQNDCLLLKIILLFFFVRFEISYIMGHTAYIIQRTILCAAQKAQNEMENSYMCVFFYEKKEKKIFSNCKFNSVCRTYVYACESKHLTIRFNLFSLEIQYNMKRKMKWKIKKQQIIK